MMGGRAHGTSAIAGSSCHRILVFVPETCVAMSLEDRSQSLAIYGSMMGPGSWVLWGGIIDVHVLDTKYRPCVGSCSRSG